MKATIESAVKVLAEQAGKQAVIAGGSVATMHLSQAALNLANILSVLNHLDKSK